MTISYYVGASQSFDVSTQYFACAYAQTGIYMDQIYSYEFVEQNPAAWWNSVPSPFMSKLHYINVGILPSLESEYNPLHLIKSMFEPNDFVAFKLDVDTSDVEIPILFEILEDPAIYSIIDEFVFELHYNCPVMVRHWGTVSVPAGYESRLQLNRVDAFRLFSELRHKGVRAHFWV